MELRGIEYLRKKLEARRRRVLIRYKQYDMKYQDKQLGLTIPQTLRQQYKAILGWCAKAVDSLADRLVFREFAEDNFSLNEIFQMNNPDVLFDSAILSALISSCCFIYISPGEESMPRLQVIDGANATGVIDEITGLLYEGYAVLERDDNGHPIQEAYFEPKRTTYYLNGKLPAESITSHNVDYPLLVPIIHRPDALRPFGRSRITRAAMYYQAYAKRTLERADITAEFYSFPQKYVVGTSQESEGLDTWKATIASMLEFTKDEDGDSPTLGQFTQPSMSPFTEQLRTAAAGFAGETGLTLDDLGFVTDNPSSAEAIKASHETLRVAAKKAQRTFGSGFLNTGFLAACLRDNFAYRRSQLYLTTPKWEPTFEADASTLSLIGDGVIKINQAIPGYFDSDTLRDLTGVKGAGQ
ncbi:MAG: phage portal protein [Ruminococcaceae bacterium]|nr:phage portal protein [Oscillospiraceae bacterium]